MRYWPFKSKRSKINMEKLRTEDLAIQSYIFTVSTPVNCFELVGSKKTTGQQILKEVLQANVTKYNNFKFA